MEQRPSNQRMLWLVVGILAGLCIAYVWPHEPAHAITVDRAEQFALLTCPVQVLDGWEGIFVFDFLTGRLEGRVMDPTSGKFTHTYFRNVSNDFNLQQTRNPQFSVVAVQAPLPNVGNATMATGVICVAEMKTGQVVCYGFPYNPTNRRMPAFEMIVIDGFQFRAPAAP